MMVVGVNGVWGQTDYSGVYYIASMGKYNKNKNNISYNASDPSNNYYLCPTEGWCYYKPDDDFSSDGTTYPNPFLTTFKCKTANYHTGNSADAVWQITKDPNSNHYFIKHLNSGRYLLSNGQIRTSNNADRMRVHLGYVADPNDLDDSALFDITPVPSTSNVVISIVWNGGVNGDHKWLTVNNGSYDNLVGNSDKTGGPNDASVGNYSNVAGIVCIYTQNDANAPFYFEKATVDPPTITNNFDGTFTITAATGATIYYTTNGDTPTTSTATTGTTSVNVNQTGDMTVIKAIARGANDAFPSLVTTYDIPRCNKPVITVSGGTVTITCATVGATIYYTTNGDPATSSSPNSSTSPVSFPKGSITTIKAIATSPGYVKSTEAQFLPPKEIASPDDIDDMGGNYILADNFSASSSIGTSENPFTGTIDGNMVTRTLSYPLVAYAEDATIKNVILKDITISGGTNVGAICNEARGECRIYNCGVLGTLTETKDEYGNVTNITSTSTISGSGYVGSIVGLLDGTSRVINCYSYATVSGGTMAAGIVGNNNQVSSQSSLKTIVVNCMFYGDITGGTSKYPVYGGNSINNDSDTGINPYCYFRKNATFTPTDYNRSWPAEEKNLTRFEYYRSVLNGNRKLCTWWVNGTSSTAPTDDDVSDVGIAKWVLDPAIAPYPILKTWGKYPSVINLDPVNRFNPETKVWEPRSTAKEWEGKSYNTLSVTINAGAHGSGSISKNITITDMDTLNCDYGYYKIQLPYYNEVFGNPNGDTWNSKYGGNYGEYVVTGWDISGGSAATNYNFADRNSYKDRVYAQGGYFYVPEGVTSISITAHWGKAVYLANRGYSIDRVKLTAADYKADKAFASAGTIANTFQGQTVYDDLQNAIKALGGDATNSTNLTVYDQAIVLIGNHQVKNGSNLNNNYKDLDVSYALDGKWHPFTIMSADLDFDNEPDNCLQLQFRRDIDRPGIQPIRFDFLPVVELGLAVRHNDLAYAIGIMVPQGHFEVTETAFMRTTQFEYDGFTKTSSNARIESKSPVILNGGEYEMFTVRYHNSDRTSYFLLGGNAWVHRFAPGAHPNKGDKPSIYLCPINVIGGQVKELYLTGLYRPELSAPSNQGAPRCYIDGGKFDIVAGAGYDKVEAGANVTFKINHAAIGEFYGGGINGSNPISGDIDVTINNSMVDKYCGGPKVGDMTGHTVTTNATGTTFGVFYGGGNGGNSYYRQLQKDGDEPSSHIGTWTDHDYNWTGFSPLATNYDDNSEAGQTGTGKKNENKGYHAEYEFEVFNQSNGVADQITQRGFIKWIQFGITKTGDVTNTLSDCKILNSFYGGGNLATVDGDVSSTLTNTEVDGSVFGAGYSAAIPTFRVHDKESKVFPSINGGVITDGHINYDSKVYEWTNDDNNGTATKTNPTYSKEVNGETKWYCYTWNPLTNLGAVTGNATLNIEGTTTVAGSVYGGGEESNVSGNTQVNITGGTVSQNVFGGGKGEADEFTCSKAMVGVNDAGKCADPGSEAIESPGSEANKDKGTKVSISNGTVNGNVYGGGEVGRVEWNTQVEIGVGTGDGPFAPVINGSVFGAGKGKETHGYAALVRGNSTVTVQGKAKVRDNVYGGGEQATVGRYWVTGIPNASCEGETEPPIPDGLPDEMPYKTRRGGKCTVIVQGEAQIGPNDGPTETAGHVFGAGKGVTPHYVHSGEKANWSKRMVDYNSEKHTGEPGTTWDYYPDNHAYVWEYFTTEDKYFEFLQTLALVTGTDVTINGSAKVKGSVHGGSESGYVQDDTDVKIKSGTIGTEGKGGAYYGNVYGGGKGDAEHMGTEKKYVAAGLVKGNTKVKIENGTILHNIYGGGAYGSVGEFTYDANGMPTGRVLSTTGGNTEVTITGGTIGTTGKDNGMVFGSSRGDVAVPEGTPRIDPNDRLAWVYNTQVTIGTQGSDTGPQIKGSVYGSGENGHTFNDTEVIVHSGTIGIETGAAITNQTTGKTYEGLRYPYRGNVYGGGCGTDDYEDRDKDNKNKKFFNFNAGIVKGNATVLIDGGHIIHNVYGGGAIGSVGTYTFVDEAYNTAHPDAKLTIGKPYECASGTGLCTVTITGGEIGVKGMKMSATGGPDDAGHVFGAGRGDVIDTLLNGNIEIVGYTNKTELTIKKNAFVRGSVYGGSESGHVLQDTHVVIGGTEEGDNNCQIGSSEGQDVPYTSEQWAEGSSLVLKPTDHWDYVDDGAPYDQYDDGTGHYIGTGNTTEGGRSVATDGHTFYGNVFAGGSGYYPYAAGEWLFSAGRVEGDAKVEVKGGHILNNVYGGCEMSDVYGNATVIMTGGTVGVPRSTSDIKLNPSIGHIFGAGMGDKRIFFNMVTNVQNSNVTISGGRVYGSVHGGGEDGHVLDKATTTIRGDVVIGSVTDGTTSGYDGNVFGGGQGSPTALTAGTVGGNVELNIQGGTMHGSIYGGGRIASVGTFFRKADDPEYGKMQAGSDHGYITVNLQGGTIVHNVYGGCMGTRGTAAVDQVRFAVSKNVTVELNKDVADNAKGCVVNGSIFGCNNVNSTPQEQVTVHIYKTQNAEATQIAGTVSEGVQPKRKGHYDVKAVYGGGNMAAYMPKGPNAATAADGYDGKHTNYSTKVIIDGCQETSIETVYGGGNAASTSATEVTVNGVYEIDELFGGGNGREQISYDEGVTKIDNPGANVGFYDYSEEASLYDTKEKRETEAFINKYVYGSGIAAVNIYGGTIHKVFGGSNTKGNVRETAITLLEEKAEKDGVTPCCPFNVGEVYGGGKSADMDADAKMYMACIPGLTAAYGGAEAADIQGDVTVNITNGRFERVFGGNNKSGTIRGAIEVNIEETGCKPIIIGQLYGGGNLASYSVYGYKKVNGTWVAREASDGLEPGIAKKFDDPVVNAKSFTSIGEIYGGGYGSTATMVGSPTVNINVGMGDKADSNIEERTIGTETVRVSKHTGESLTINEGEEDETSVEIPLHKENAIGAIGKVFGGGNEAKVMGDTQVNIGTQEYVIIKTLSVGASVKGYYKKVNDEYTACGDDETAAEGTTYYKAVIGADIRGNVYGGGNNAEVTGNANVTIGKKVE